MYDLVDLYNVEVSKDLKKKFGYGNNFEIPRLEKICINIGFNANKVSDSDMEDIANDLALIAGQYPIFTIAKKSIASFKTRKGMVIGCAVTLRKAVMYNFLQRLLFISLPRMREFKGCSMSSFDGSGNFNIGIKDRSIFPEISVGKEIKNNGLNITIITTAKTSSEAKELLVGLKFPFVD